MIGKKKARSFKALSSVGVLTVALTLYSRAHWAFGFRASCIFSDWDEVMCQFSTAFIMCVQLYWAIYIWLILVFLIINIRSSEIVYILLKLLVCVC